MFSTTPFTAFIPTVQPEKAKVFYRDVLGLWLGHEDEFALHFEANGTPLRVTKVPPFVPYPFTVFGWNVTDITSLLAALKEKGVVFEQYSFPGQDANGVWTSPSGSKIAWFKDPDGNLLSIAEHTSTTK